MPQTSPRKQRLNAIEGEVPDLVGEMDGCPFAPRCEYAADECRTGDIPMVEVGDGQRAKCCRLSTVERAWERERAQRRRHHPASGAMSGSEPVQLGRHDGETPAVEVRHLSKRFAQHESLLDQLFGDREYVQAVTDVSLSLYESETLGLVGESGSGKSTLANVIAGLYTPTSGQVCFDGEPVGHATDRPRSLLSDVGMVFQNPKNSLDPRMQLREVIAEPLKIQGWAKERRKARISELADVVELSEALLRRYPHEVSGGQAQRAAVARAIALDPSVVILDEPVSALDVSVQAKILNLLMDLQAELGLTYLLIAHDLSVVGHMADRVAVMYLGRIMEVAPTTQLFEHPTNPYTEALLSAIPSVDPTEDTDDRIILEGDIPSPVNPPTGCPFHTRCPVAEKECETTDPPVKRVGEADSRCHFAGEYSGPNRKPIDEWIGDSRPDA